VKRVVQLLALAGGAIGFAILVDRVGWRTMQDAVTHAGWWFLWIALIDLASVFSDSAAVYCFVRANGPVSYWRVLAAQASGIAINRLTPGNSLGEGVKVSMIVDHVPSRGTALSSIVKFNVTTLYVAVTVIVIGVPLTLLGLEVPAHAERIVWFGTGAIVLLALLLGLLLRRGVVRTALGAVRALGFASGPRTARWLERASGIDASIRGFSDPWSRRGVLFVWVSRACHCTAIVCVLHAAAVPLSPQIVIGMMSVGTVITWMAGIVPLGIGLADGTYYLFYGALGASPVVGLAFAMVNRTRTLVLAAMGLGALAIATLVDRRPLSERNPDATSGPRTEVAATP
jgi:hypothetical protein